MNTESIFTFLLLIAPFAIAFFLEALVIYFFRLGSFWRSVGASIAVNLLSLLVLYGSSLLLGKIGYEFNGLQLPLQVVFFLWWISIVAEGLLLQLFFAKKPRLDIYKTAIVMNSISYLFLYFFIINSH